LLSALFIFFSKDVIGGYCQECVSDICYTQYPTNNDDDGDGMNDQLEDDLAWQFVPLLVVDFANLERISQTYNDHDTPWWVPWYMDIDYLDPFDDDPGDHIYRPYNIPQTPPIDMKQDTSIYYRVHPVDIQSPGECRYIEIVYWFYHPYSVKTYFLQHMKHNHDWESIALMIWQESPGEPYTIAALEIGTHNLYNEREPHSYHVSDIPFWYGVPGQSRPLIYLNHATFNLYGEDGDHCLHWADPLFCDCVEHVTGEFYLNEIIDVHSNLYNLREVGSSGAPAWLSYQWRWPGMSNHGLDCDYGPAQGTANGYLWDYSHFPFVLWCVRTELVNIAPVWGLAVNPFDGNNVRITWNEPDPSGGLIYDPQNDGFAIRKKLTSSSDDEWVCVGVVGPQVFEYTVSNLCPNRRYDFSVQTHHPHPDPYYNGCSFPEIVYAVLMPSNGTPCDPPGGDECPIISIYDTSSTSYVESNNILSDVLSGSRMTLDIENFLNLNPKPQINGGEINLKLHESSGQLSKIDIVELLFIDYPESSHLGIDESNQFFAYFDKTSPISAQDDQQNDILSLIIQKDDGNSYSRSGNGYAVFEFEGRTDDKINTFPELPRTRKAMTLRGGSGTINNVEIYYQAEDRYGSEPWYKVDDRGPLKNTQDQYLFNQLGFYLHYDKDFKIKIEWKDGIYIDYVGLAIKDSAATENLSFELINLQSAVNQDLISVTNEINMEDGVYTEMGPTEYIDLTFSDAEMPSEDGSCAYYLRSVGYYFPFDQEPPTATLVTPNGGEWWACGSSQLISWEASDNIGIRVIDLNYSTDGGSSWIKIVEGLPDTGSTYLWEIPLIPTDRCKLGISVYDYAGLSAEDESDAFLKLTFEGNVSYDLTWNESATITGDVIVDPGAVLTIEEGADLTFYYEPKLIVNGSFVSQGNSEDTCRFISAYPAQQNWQGIEVNEGAVVQLNFTELAYADNGIEEWCSGFY
jgi:hypothetical protein